MAPAPSEVGSKTLIAPELRNDLCLGETVDLINRVLKLGGNLHLVGLIFEADTSGSNGEYVPYVHPLVTAPGDDEKIFALGGLGFASRFPTKSATQGGGIAYRSVSWGGAAETEVYPVLNGYYDFSKRLAGFASRQKGLVGACTFLPVGPGDGVVDEEAVRVLCGSKSFGNNKFGQELNFDFEYVLRGLRNASGL